MLGEDLTTQDERGEGLVLHHQELRQAMQRSPKPLPHIDDEILVHMEQARQRWGDTNQTTTSIDNLLPDFYRDPVVRDRAHRFLAAFAPVLVRGRPAALCDTGWFVVVQQRQEPTGDSID